jgi:hypothetical protein
MLFWWRGRIRRGKELGSGRRVRVFPSLMAGREEGYLRSWSSKSLVRF